MASILKQFDDLDVCYRR